MILSQSQVSLIVQSLYLFGLTVAILAPLWLAFYAFRRRHVPGSMTFVLFMVGGAEMAASFAALSITQSPELAFIWARLRFVGLAFLPVLYVIFVAEFTGTNTWISARTVGLLLIIPVLTQVFVWVGGTSNLFFADWMLARLGLLSVEQSHFTGWYWVHSVYSVCLTWSAFFKLVRYARQAQAPYRQQANWLIFGTLVSLIPVVPSLLLHNTLPVNFTPIGNLIASFIAAWVLFRHRLLDIVPVAYESIYQSMHDGVVIINMHNTIVQANSAAELALNKTRRDMIGKSIFEIIPQAANCEPALNNGENTFEVLSTAGGDERAYEIRLSRILDARGTLAGRLVVTHDISDRKRREAIVEEERHLLEVLHEVSQSINSSLVLDDVLEHILDSVNRVVPYDGADIRLIEHGYARYVMLRGYEAIVLEDNAVKEGYPVEDGLVTRTIVHSQQPVLIPYTDREPEFTTFGGIEWERSFLAAPIKAGNTIIGIIGLASKTPGYFTIQHMRRLDLFAVQASVAVQNAHLYRRSQEAAVEHERQRIARELHDSVSQTLFSANMVAQSLPHLWRRGEEEIRSGIAELTRLTNGALAEMRTLLVELRAEAIEKGDLAELLGHLLTAMSGQQPIKTHLKTDGVFRAPSMVQVAFYRVAQEAMNNIVKHARAQRVDATLKFINNQAEMCIKDDGVGFDSTAVPPNHFGLSIMHERADDVGARLTVRSTIGEGTQISMSWPAQS